MITCTKCKRSLPREAFSADRRKKNGCRSHCKECSAKAFKAYMDKPEYQDRLQRYLENRHKRDPRLNWVTSALANCKRRAEKQGVPFDLDRETLLSILTEKCPLLDLKFTYRNGKAAPSSPSVDRKDPSKGYVLSNIWIISAKANRIKSDATPEEIEMLARRLKQLR